MNLYGKNIIAYKISYFNDNNLVIETLNETIRKQKDVSGLILHPDQVYQYTSSEYKAICESNGIIISMSRKSTPTDNAPIENFHANLKNKPSTHINHIFERIYTACKKLD